MRLIDWKRSPLYDNVLLRVVVHYVVMGTAAWFLREYTPTAWGVLGGEEAGALLSGRPGKAEVAATIAQAATQPVALPAIVAMVTAFVTSLPVAWVYTLTRNKKGYQQSVVQTMIILPVIIAGIVVLVKHSVALAFSLGGIVAAVRFRTARGAGASARQPSWATRRGRSPTTCSACDARTWKRPRPDASRSSAASSRAGSTSARPRSLTARRCSSTPSSRSRASPPA